MRKIAYLHAMYSLNTYRSCVNENLNKPNTVKITSSIFPNKS